MKRYILAIVVIIVVIFVATNVLRQSSMQKGSLRIGVISTLTGNAAYSGQSTMRGAEVGKEKVLELHKGMSIELFHEDSLFTPKGGIDAYNKLKATEQINALISQASNVSVALQPVAAKDDMLYVAASVLANSFSTPDDLSYRLTAKADVEAKPALEYLQNRGVKKLAILYINNEIGVSLSDSLKKEAAAYGITIVSEEGIAPEKTDFRTLVAKVKNSKAEALYFASIAAHTATVLEEMSNTKLDIPVVSYRGAEDVTLIKNAPKLAEKVVYTNAFDSEDTSPANRTFREAFMKKYGEEPNGYAAEAYEAVLLITDTYAKCADDRACAREYLQGVKDRPSVLGPLTFDRFGDVTYPFFLKTVREGKFVRLKE